MQCRTEEKLEQWWIERGTVGSDEWAQTMKKSLSQFEKKLEIFHYRWIRNVLISTYKCSKRQQVSDRGCVVVSNVSIPRRRGRRCHGLSFERRRRRTPSGRVKSDFFCTDFFTIFFAIKIIFC